MAVNIVTPSEDFDHADWTAFDGCTITQDSHAAPTFAGVSAGLADTINDPAATAASLYSTYRTVGNDSSSWTTSLYVQKDADTARFPEIHVQFAGGTGVFGDISINTSTGATLTAGSGGTAPAAQGVEDVDGTWWRFWLTVANNSSGNTILRMGIFPARSNSLGGSQVAELTGSIIAWGANQTNDATVQTYDPDPFYSFDVPRPPMILTFLQ